MSDKRIKAPMQLELELVEVETTEFPCPYCKCPITVEVDNGDSEES